jgi:branched-chain amino acid transport system permease protein
VISWIQVVIVVVAVILMLALSFMVYKTKIGFAMRCISQDAETAKLMGIRVNKVITFTFFVSAIVASIAGIMIGVNYQAVDITMAASVGLKSFAAAVLGGMGILPGAVLGGLVIGIVETMVAGYVSSGLRDAIAFAILIIVLIVKPNGLLGKNNINKV